MPPRPSSHNVRCRRSQISIAWYQVIAYNMNTYELVVEYAIEPRLLV